MVREDKVTMSGKELRRVHVIRQVVEKRSTQREAGRLMGLTDRQIRRLMRRVKQEGDQGLLLVFDAPQARFDRQHGTSHPAALLIRRASAVDLVRRLSELRVERLQALGRLEAEAPEDAEPMQRQGFLQCFLQAGCRRPVDQPWLRSGCCPVRRTINKLSSRASPRRTVPSRRA